MQTIFRNIVWDMDRKCSYHSKYVQCFVLWAQTEVCEISHSQHKKKDKSYNFQVSVHWFGQRTVCTSVLLLCLVYRRTPLHNTIGNDWGSPLFTFVWKNHELSWIQFSIIQIRKVYSQSVQLHFQRGKQKPLSGISLTTARCDDESTIILKSTKKQTKYINYWQKCVSV